MIPPDETTAPPKETTPKQKIAALLLLYLSAIQSGPAVSEEDWEECSRRKKQLGAEL